jgi:ribosomal protein L11 methyltransferase
VTAAGGDPAAKAVRVTVPAGEAELAADVLWGAGASAIEERPPLAAGGAVVLVAGPAAGADAESMLAAAADRWPAELITLDLDAALDAWRAHARAVRVGRLVVRPPWVDEPAAGDPGVLEVVVDPGRAFGSGAHVSTRLALAALVDLVRGGERVLDVGCGSGVLAIAAVRLGASGAIGVDVDPAAVAAAKANARRNGVAGRVTVVEGDAAGGVALAGPYDLVVANMLAPELRAVAPAVAAGLAPGGVAVLSGLLVEQRSDVLAAFGGVGLHEVGDPRTDEGWTALVLSALARHIHGEV